MRLLHRFLCHYHHVDTCVLSPCRSWNLCKGKTFFPYFLIDNSDLTYFVDCSIDTGYDADKAMALGAHAVAVGRGILAPLLKESKDGVVKKVRRMNEQLSEMMMYTGIADTLSFDASVIHFL
uniref:alpha-hydroxy-acid oxidizing protein n=1 Tax=Prevotella sp. TaxID=59823 RepID=UPI004029B5E0